MRPQEANYSAALIPAYAATKADTLGISVAEVYAEMGIKIAGPDQLEADAAPDAAPVEKQVILDQNQNFEGVVLEDVRVNEETGEEIMIRQDAGKLWTQTQKRRDTAQRLRDCLNG
jgi:hypothetical protein